MTIMEINETEIFYEETGSGIPFLVIHGGLGVDHNYFRPPLDTLAEFMKLIYYDQRGHGKSGRPPVETITFEQLADDAEALREKLGVEKIGIMGHSAGGYVALNYAIRHPDTISHLILLDTAPAMDYSEELMANIMKKNPSQQVMEAVNAPAASTSEGFREQFTTMMPLYFHEFSAEMEKKIKKGIAKMNFSPEINIHQDTLIEKYNMTPFLKDISAPTLILVGDDDFICPPSQGRRMHEQIPNSELHVFEQCGHFPFYEAQDKFTRVIRDWIQK